MITTHFPLGDVRFSAEYFSTLVGEAAKISLKKASASPLKMAAWSSRSTSLSAMG